MLPRALFTRNLNIVWAVNLCMVAGGTVFNVLLPLYIEQGGYPEGINGFILGTASLGMLLSLVLMGPAIDRGDSRRYLSAGIFLWSLGSLLVLMPSSAPLTLPSGPVLIAVRGLQGFGLAIFHTSIIIYATRSAPVELQGAALGLIEAEAALSISLMPFAAFWLEGLVGYRVTFAVAGAIPLLMALAALFLEPRIGRGSSQPAQGQPKLLLSSRAILPGLVAAALYFAASSYVSLAPLIAQRLGVTAISAYMSIRAFCTVPTRLFSGTLSDCYGGRLTIVPGFLLSFSGMALLPVLYSPGWVFVPPVLLGLGMGIASPAITNWMLRRIDPAEHAVSINTLSMLCESSGFLGTWLGGLLLQGGMLPGSLFAVVLAGGLIVYRSTGGMTKRDISTNEILSEGLIGRN